MNARNVRPVIVWSFMALLVALVGTGCAKKVAISRPTPPPPSTPAPTAGPAPTLSLTVSPGTIEKGQAATLTWNASNAQTVTIEPLGTVPTSGSRTVTPETSTTYAGKAVSGSQVAEATARLTVTAPEVAGTPVQRGEEGEGLEWPNVRDIHFDYDRYDIRSEDETILRRNADIFKKNADSRIIIEGHCDERGTEEYNQALGDRRATAARQTLERLGVPASRMTAVSFGKTRPLDPGHNEEAWAKNRRAHFVKQ